MVVGIPGCMVRRDRVGGWHSWLGTKQHQAAHGSPSPWQISGPYHKVCTRSVRPGSRVMEEKEKFCKRVKNDKREDADSITLLKNTLGLETG